MKTCTKCGNTKPVDQFSKDRTKVDGLRTQCKQCKKQVDYAYQSERRETYRARTEQWKSVNRERYLTYLREYNQAHAS